jgi:hypothetical protein
MGINHKKMEDDLILESLVLPKTALLILQCESFLFPETEVLLNGIL